MRLNGRPLTPRHGGLLSSEPVWSQIEALACTRYAISTPRPCSTLARASKRWPSSLATPTRPSRLGATPICCLLARNEPAQPSIDCSEEYARFNTTSGSAGAPPPRVALAHVARFRCDHVRFARRAL